jgi:hypothetical protein
MADKMVYTAETRESSHRRTLELIDYIIKKSPKLIRKETASILEEHRWWLREADRHATDGFYDGGEFPTFGLLNVISIFGDDEFAKSHKRLEGLVATRRFIELYEKVQTLSYQQNLFTNGALDISALLDGTYKGIINRLKDINQVAGVAEFSDSCTDILLPRGIIKMTYPFLHLRGLSNLPPRPSDLRVLHDWEINFSDCFDSGYIFDIGHPNGKGRGISVKVVDGYGKHAGANSQIENWILDVARYNHSFRAFTTINGTWGRIDFATRQRNMHKKFWLYKAQKIHEYFDGKHPMLHDPREVYNAARRAVRRTHSYLKGLSKEFNMEYHTFPKSMNP